MSEKEKSNLIDTVKILMQLDKRSLLLIDSGARLLAARQDMDREQMAVQTVTGSFAKPQ